MNLADMIRKQEVAWLDANDMPVHGDSDYEESDENEPHAEVGCLQSGGWCWVGLSAVCRGGLRARQTAGVRRLRSVQGYDA